MEGMRNNKADIGFTVTMIEWHRLSGDTLTGSWEGYRFHVYGVDEHKWRWCIVWDGKTVYDGQEYSEAGAIAKCEHNLKSL